MLKVCLLVVENPTDDDDPSDGGNANSVKKVIILADVFDIPENYNNVMTIWNQIGLDDLKLICACDHKMSNIICGIQVSLNDYSQRSQVNMN